MTLWDTAGQEEFDKLRTLSYADTHVVVLCFAADNPVSLENVETRWVPEIRDHCPGVKIILVALKCDLRSGGEGEKRRMLSYQDGVRVAKRIHASRYLECSAKLNRGVNQASLEIASVAAHAHPNRSTTSSCTIA
ncbi:rho3 gtp binding protein [Moesziomyces aphidis]|uniref:Rho3 gtp binding protein n=1 Tax=Moesziomyces aphidis TaxID=84754 RepID=W3VU84_MOEAP|nr:rho3 gtp binding protein [Moesziomyces aphidis]